MVPLPAICLFIGWQWDLEKKMKKGLIICFLGVVLYGGFYFVLHGEKEVRQQNVIDMQNGKISIDDSVNQEKDNGEIKSVWEKIALSKYGGAEFLTMDDVVSNNKIEFRINSVKVTKKFDVAWVCPYESATNFKHDKNMNITEKQSYVAFNMTVNNTKKKKNGKRNDFYYNGIFLMICNSSGASVDGFEMYTVGMDKKYTNAFFRADLNPGETITTDFVYVIPDKYIRKKNYIYLHFDIFGLASPAAEDIKIMKTSLGHE